MVSVLLTALAMAPLSLAQGPEDPGAGKGGPIIEPNFGGDIQTLNPILAKDGPSASVIARLFPVFIGADPNTGLPVEGAKGALATKWTVSEDGLTYTFTIRDDWKWSDGTPITASDVQYAFDAVASGKVDTTLKSFLEDIESVTAPDAKTVVVKFKKFDCGAILTAAGLVVVPSKKYQEVYPTFEDMKPENAYNLNATVTAGEFKFSNFRAGEQTTLVADQGYPDAIAKHVIPEAWVLKQTASQDVGVEQFLNGQITFIGSVPEARQDEMKKLGEEGKLQYNELPASSRHVLAFNVADPKNPKNGQDEKGNPVDQGHHPIFGDKRVRQAFAYAVDHSALNKGAFNGHGIPLGTPVLPKTWAFNENVKPYAYDPAKAAALLEEAGWIDDDNNADTPRVANDKTLYAKPGDKLEFTLTTFSGNPSVEAANVLMQDQLKKVGFKVNLETLEFQAMVKKLQEQTFDTVTFFLPISRNNPGLSLLSHHGARGDVLNAGLNAGSFYNKEFEDLVSQSQTLKGCDQAERKKLLDKAQEIWAEELPWYIVNYSMVPFVAQATLKNYDPKPFGLRWNIDAWFAPGTN